LEFAVDVRGFRVEGGRVRGVETSDGLIECDAAVLCTGARAADLARTAEIDLPVTPQRRQIVWARTRDALPAEMPMVIDIGTGFHFRPARDFRVASLDEQRTTPSAQSGGHPSFVRTGACTDILFAYPDPEEPSSISTEFEDLFVDKVYEKAKARARFLFEAECVREKCRAGLYENTPDHHAILGGCEVGGLYFANGFSGHGVMHSPATGRALSEIILDGEAKFLDVSCLALERFASGELLHETAFI
jgi:sarcosine oxidase, subunit beta